MLSAVSFLGTEGVSGFHELLCLLKHGATDNRFMGTGDVVPVFLALIANRLKGHRIGGIGFLQQRITDVTFTFKNVTDGGVKPLYRSDP